MSLGQLSLWEEMEGKQAYSSNDQVGKMQKNISKYTCHSPLLVKKDCSRRFCIPLNMQTRQDLLSRCPLLEMSSHNLGSLNGSVHWIYNQDCNPNPNGCYKYEKKFVTKKKVL
jgi:hypothetical protein